MPLSLILEKLVHSQYR